MSSTLMVIHLCTPFPINLPDSVQLTLSPYLKLLYSPHVGISALVLMLVLVSARACPRSFTHQHCFSGTWHWRGRNFPSSVHHGLRMAPWRRSLPSMLLLPYWSTRKRSDRRALAKSNPLAVLYANEGSVWPLHYLNARIGPGDCFHERYHPSSWM